MKKKIALLLPAFFLALSLGACNGKKDEKKSDGDGQQQPSGGEGQGGEGQGGEGSGGEGQGGEGSGGEGQGGEGQGGEGQGGEGGGQQGGGEEANDGRSSEPFATGASMQVGSRYYELASYEETMGSPEGAWKKEGFNAEAGEAVAFYLDGQVLEVFSDGDSSGNNITEEHPMQDAVEEVHIKAGGDMSVYLKHWESGAYTFWITTPAQGGGEGEGQGGEGQEGAITYTCTDLPDWITNDGCVIFAWVWSPSDGGSWKACEYGDPATSLTFEVDAELTGFLLARCIAGTTTPDWAIKDDSVGRVYNQTENIDCTSGTYSYACAAWKEYK